MTISAFFFICIQICLIQNAFTQYLSPPGPCSSGYDFSYGGSIVSPAGLAAPYALGAGSAAVPYGVAQAAVPFGVAPAAIELGAYGGAGIGDVIVAGQIPVGGTTLVAGQVPILGSVRFAGDLPAAGTVSISGSCGCGYGNAGYYY